MSRYFVVKVYLILTQPTQIPTPVTAIKHVISFSLNVSQRRDIDRRVEFNDKSYDAKHVTVAHCTKKFYTKNLEKAEKT